MTREFDFPGPWTYALPMRRSAALLIGLFVLIAATPATPARFAASGFDRAVDLHGNPANADLVLFVAGNQWFVMPELLAAFQAKYPSVRTVFYETLPPGVLGQQIESGTLAVDDLLLQMHGDAYLSGRAGAAKLRSEGLIGSSAPYASNGLGIMVRAGNPLHIQSMNDLGRSDVRLAMPNVKTEGIARQIEASYKLAGGDALDATIMQKKVADGTTIMTTIHHRETPAWILSGKVDAGPVWLTEARYQERIGSGLVGVAIPASESVTETYVASPIVGAPHEAAAQAFIAFLISPQGQAIYRSYGFSPPVPVKE